MSTLKSNKVLLTFTVEDRKCHHNRTHNTSRSSISKDDSLKRLPGGKVFIIHMRFHQVAVRHFVAHILSNLLPRFFGFNGKNLLLLLPAACGAFTHSCKVSHFSISHTFAFFMWLFFGVSDQRRALRGSNT